MNQPCGNAETTNSKGKHMDILVFIGVLAVWIILQIWILPRLGVRT